MKITAPRTPELLAKIEAEMAKGWSFEVACRKANTYKAYVYLWAEDFPEWKALKTKARKR